MVFYKYCGSAGQLILESLRLKVTPPDEFNDPFELTPRTQRLRWKEIINRFQNDPVLARQGYESLKAHGFQPSFEQFQDALVNSPPRQRRGSRQELMDLFTVHDMTALKEASSQIGILCLSNINNSIPMWSYYGDCHRGTVIGLELSPSVDGVFNEVKYRPHRQQIDLYISRSTNAWFDQITRAIFSKSRVWKHEQEYRWVFRLKDLCRQAAKNGDTHYFLPIKGVNVKEVILGCNMKANHATEIKQLLRRRRESLGHVKLFRCHRHRSRYALDIRPEVLS